MSGIRSGRSAGLGRDTVETCHSLDVRHMHKAGWRGGVFTAYKKAGTYWQTMTDDQADISHNTSPPRHARGPQAAP